MIIRNETIEYIAYTVHRLYFNSSCLNILSEAVKNIHPPKNIPIPDDLEYETISDILLYFSGYKNRKVGINKILEILKLVIDPRVHNKLGEELSRGYISEFNKYLGQDKLEIQRRGKDFKFVELTKARMRDKRTLTDHISEAMEYFKSEHSKVKTVGLPYEYDLNSNSSILFHGKDVTEEFNKIDLHEVPSKINGRTKAIIQLYRDGYIKRFEIKQRPEELGVEFDYAICYINEKRMFADLKPNGKKMNLYITQEGNDFFYKGKPLSLSKKYIYCKVFYALFELRPTGGTVTYKELIKKVKLKISKTKLMPDDEIIIFIQNNITGNKNGLLKRLTTLGVTGDTHKPIIETVPDIGIRFNNETE